MKTLKYKIVKAEGDSAEVLKLINAGCAALVCGDRFEARQSGAHVVLPHVTRERRTAHC